MAGTETIWRRIATSYRGTLLEPGLDGCGFVAQVSADSVGGWAGAEVAPLVEGGEGHGQVVGYILGGPEPTG